MAALAIALLTAPSSDSASLMTGVSAVQLEAKAGAKVQSKVEVKAATKVESKTEVKNKSEAKAAQKAETEIEADILSQAESMSKSKDWFGNNAG